MNNFIKVANEATATILNKDTSQEMKKRGKYCLLSPERRFLVGKLASVNGIAKAMRSPALKGVPRSTVHNLKNQHNECIKKNETLERLERKKAGRPTLLPEDVDQKITKYLLLYRAGGGIINTNVLLAMAKAIADQYCPTALVENGGNAKLTKSWAQSIFRRLGFVLRKSTKEARKIPQDFVQLKEEYIKFINDLRHQHAIPDHLIFNVDETGVNYVPVGNWTMEKEGAKQVSVVGMESKKQITVTLGITLGGVLLPPQVIYEGTTERCHPNQVVFPPGWNVTHSASHWSTEQTFLEFCQAVVVPHAARKRMELNLQPQQMAMLIMDVFASHRCPSVIQYLQANFICPVFVPGSCTGELQPLDVNFNHQFKHHLKTKFQLWYAGIFTSKLQAGDDLEDIRVDIRPSRLKALHARWLMEIIAVMKEEPERIVSAFEMCGIKQGS